MRVLTQFSKVSIINCLIASSVWGLVGLWGIDVEEIVEARLPPEALAVAIGWCKSKKRTFVPVTKQLMWALVGG